MLNVSGGLQGVEIEAQQFPDPKKEATQKNDKVVAVWAIESKGFRSFRYDRVKSVMEASQSLQTWKKK